MQKNSFKKKRARKLLLRMRNAGPDDVAETMYTVNTSDMIKTFQNNTIKPISDAKAQEMVNNGEKKQKWFNDKEYIKKINNIIFPLGIKVIWESVDKTLVQPNISDQFKQIGMSWIENGIQKRDPNSYYDQIRRNYNILPQNNQDRLNVMLNFANLSKNTYYEIDEKWNKYKALKSEIERYYNNSIEILRKKYLVKRAGDAKAIRDSIEDATYTPEMHTELLNNISLTKIIELENETIVKLKNKIAAEKALAPMNQQEVTKYENQLKIAQNIPEQDDNTALLKEQWDNAVGPNSVYRLWEKNMTDVDPDNKNGLIGQMYKWINIVEINIINLSKDDGTAVISDGNYQASWLINDVGGGVGKNPPYIKSIETHTNHIQSNILFNFVKKNTIQSSSDRTNQLKKISQIKSFNTSSKRSNPNYSVKNNEITKYNNYSTFMTMKNGYNILNSQCRSKYQSKLARNLKDSVITEVDVSENYLLDGANGEQTGFPINGRRTSLGLLAKEAKTNRINYNNVYEKLTKYKVKKIISKDCSLVKNENKSIVPEPHILDHEDEKHYHYFPISGKRYGLYIHNHGVKTGISHDNIKIPKTNFQFFTQRFSKNPKVDF